MKQTSILFRVLSASFPTYLPQKDDSADHGNNGTDGDDNAGDRNCFEEKNKDDLLSWNFLGYKKIIICVAIWID